MNARMTPAIGGVLPAAATVVGCGGGGYSSPASPSPSSPAPAPAPAASAADVTITIVGMNGANSSSPNPATVKVGQTVAWRNADALTHTAMADAGAFDTGNIAPGAASGLIAMNTAGSFPYHCAIHGFVMVGTLTVTP